MDLAADGEERLFAGLNYPLDAAIVDISLPIRSGLEIIRRRRLQERVFPVVVLTARNGWRSRVDGRRPKELTTFEFRLLQILMLNAGKVLA